MESRKELSSNHSRWQPTKEQVEILESVYSTGVKTPSPEQIQKITARLSVYGEIEGKNVFYWFQNTKARRRLNDRRSPCLSRFSPHFFPPYVPPILPNGLVSEMAGYYYYPYMSQVDSTRAASLKTLELFPLHPEAMAEDEDRCYRNCARPSVNYEDDDSVHEGHELGFIDFFSFNGGSCTTATTIID